MDVQNRLKKAEARLPAEVVQNGISVEKQAASKLMTITLLSSDPKFDEIYLSNYATLNVLDLLRRIPGVGSISNVGSRYYAMQIWVQPDKLADLGLTVKDLQSALKDQNRESAAGVLGQAPMTGLDVTIPITAQRRLSSVSEFEDIVIRANSDGSIIRLRDVATISLEASSYNTESGINGGNAAVLEIKMLPGANAMEVAELVKAAMEEISRNFPEGISHEIPFDMTTYISESIHHVYQTLFEALLLVILVVFLSLQSWRATLIPIVAVPISLIGTFGVMLVFGFSLNMLTLLGLILAIGIVVDDAIVVVENVDRIMNEEGLSPYEATKKAMRSLSGALIAMSLVLCAVFVPVSFLSGITGQLYRQFTITIAVSVIISTVVALTLSPVMCAYLLKPDRGGRKKRFFRYINFGLAKGNKLYGRMIGRALAHSRRMFAAFGVVLIGIWLMNKLVPESFMPQEDQESNFTVGRLPEGGATIPNARRGDRPCDCFSDAGSGCGVCTQCDGFESPRGQQPGPQPVDGNSQVLEGARIGGDQRSDEACARRVVALSRKQGLSFDACRHSRSGNLGRFRNGARSSRGCRLCRSAAGGGYVDALCRAAARVYGAGLFDASRYSAALFRRGPRQSAVGRGFDVRHLLYDESVHGFDLRQ